MKDVFFVVALLAVGVPALAQGVIVYDNGGPNLVNGNEMTRHWQAEDFVLSDHEVITHVQYWTLESPAGGFKGALYYAFYEDNQGEPGDLILKRRAVDIKRTYTGRLWEGRFREFEMSFRLAEPVELDTDVTYWFAMRALGPEIVSFRYEDVYWETTDKNGTYPGREWVDDPGYWHPNRQEHAFNLRYVAGVVPEPGLTVLLGGLLLTGVGFLRRR